MYAIYSKGQSNPNKKWNLARVSLEHTTLPLSVPRSTNWANGAFDTIEEQDNILKHWIYGNYLKRFKQKVMVRMSLEHMTLSLVAPRSTDWANRPFDTNVLQNNIFNAMNVRRLQKVISTKSEIWSIWVSNTEHYCY